MRLIRIVFSALLALIVVAVIAAQFISLNQFKGLAAQKVKEATGRDLEIGGDISVSFYPVLGASLQQISLSNMKGAEQPAMVSMEKLLVGVKVLPLLQKKVELDKIILEKPIVHLEKTAGGVANWEFASAQKSQAGEAGGNTKKTLPVILSGIEIRDGSLTYHDGKSGKAVELSNLNAKLKLQDLDSPVELQASANYQGQPVEIKLLTQQPMAIATEKGSATVLEAKLQGVPVRLDGTLSVTPEQFRFANLTVATLGTQAKGNIGAKLGGDAPVFDVALQFGALNLEPLMNLSKAAGAAAGAASGAAPTKAKSGRYVEPDALANMRGTVALSAESLATGDMEILKPQLKANIAGGMAAVAAAGQYVGKGKPPIRFNADSQNLIAVLQESGGPVNLTASGEGLKLALNGGLSLLPGVVQLRGADIRYNDMAVRGDASLKETNGDQAVNADVALAQGGRDWQIKFRTPALNKLLGKEGAPVELDATSGEQRFTLKGTVTKLEQLLKINPLSVTTNGGTGNGYLSYDQQSAVPLLTLNMQFTALDLNPLLAFSSGGDKAQGGGSADTSGGKKATSPFRTMDADVRLKADSLKVQNISLQKVDATVALKDGVMRIQLPDTGLYEGEFSLNATVDGSSASTPRFSAETTGKGVNIGNFLRAANGSNTFAGIGGWNANFTGNATGTPQLYPTLNGRGNFEVERGVVRGMDLFRLMSAVRGEMGAQSLVRTTDETNNLNVTGTFEMASGIIRNNDLVVRSPNIEASGKGEISLPQWNINYRLEPKVGERRKAGEGEKFVGQSIPVNITGSLDKPSVGPDKKALVGSGIDALKTIKEGGFGDKVKKLDDALRGFGIDTGSTPAPKAPADPNAPATTAPTPQPLNPADALKGLLGQ